MSRPVWCRWCQAEDHVAAGVFPETCAICGNIGRWSMVAGVPLLERRKNGKRPRVPFDLTHNDKRLLKAARILPE